MWLAAGAAGSLCSRAGPRPSGIPVLPRRATAVRRCCLGRTWEVGPQREFYLPESWLNFGPGRKNVVAVSLLPLTQGATIFEASVEPAAEFAEVRRTP